MFVELCLCAKTCTLGTCTYLNIAYYHPSMPHATPLPPSCVPSSCSVCFFSHSAHFVCPFCLSVSVEYCCSAFAICCHRYAWLARTGGQQTRRNRWVERGRTRFPLLTLPHYAFYRLHIKVLFTNQAVDPHLSAVHQFVGRRHYE